MKRILHIFLALLALASLASCKEGRVIPEGKMSKIYADLFMADYWLELHASELGPVTDTSLVYEPVFAKYGFTSDEFRASMSHYLNDTDKYARILKHTTLILEERLKALQDEKAKRDLIEESIKDFGKFNSVKINYLSGLCNNDKFSVGDSLFFYVDTTGGQWNFDPQKGYDKAFYGPEVIIR